MKIKGWDKISGYTYKGYCIVNPIHNAEETKYSANVLDLNTPNKTKWELSVLMPKHKFIQDNDVMIILWDENKNSTTKSILKDTISTIAGFRMVFENLVDELLKKRLISAPTGRSSSMYYTNPNGGIINQINQNGVTMPYGQIVQSIQNMQQTITNLTNNTPPTPF